MVDIVSRAAWGARPAKGRSTIALPTPGLFLHHTAGSEPDGPAGVRRVQDFHMDRRGYLDIAYSFLVDRKGVVYEGRGAGVQGGHTAGHNTTSHAICVLGNYETEPVSGAAVQAVADLVAYGHAQGWWPDRLTGGHRDVGSTACPGRNLYALIGDINDRATEDDMSVSSWAKAAWDKARARGVISDSSRPKDNVTVEQLMVFLDRAGALDASSGGGLSEGQADLRYAPISHGHRATTTIK